MKPSYFDHSPQTPEFAFSMPICLKFSMVGDCPGSASFPSNHTANMVALGGVCRWYSRGKHTSGKREYCFLWFLLPLVIGYSHIYLGYHYPLDAPGGCGNI